jgi:hypothetical protein
MIRNLLVVVLLTFTPNAFANPEEGCIDANYSKILTVEHLKSGSEITIKLKTVRPEEVFVKDKLRGDSLELELHHSYIARERIFIGIYLELRDMGGWTQLRVKGGKKLLSEKVEGSYLILVVSL